VINLAPNFVITWSEPVNVSRMLLAKNAIVVKRTITVLSQDEDVLLVTVPRLRIAHNVMTIMESVLVNQV
jgi:hypothetical protein